MNLYLSTKILSPLFKLSNFFSSAADVFPRRFTVHGKYIVCGYASRAILRVFCFSYSWVIMQYGYALERFNNNKYGTNMFG